VRAFAAFVEQPRCGEVYNLGGGRENAASVLECIALIEEVGGHRVRWTLSDENRVGDHICYISDLRKMRSHLPGWSLTHDLRSIVAEMVAAEEARLSVAR
jgi:CDP-paratose 2-epimerase